MDVIRFWTNLRWLRFKESFLDWSQLQQFSVDHTYLKRVLRSPRRFTLSYRVKFACRFTAGIPQLYAVPVLRMWSWGSGFDMSVLGPTSSMQNVAVLLAFEFVYKMTDALHCLAGKASYCIFVTSFPYLSNCYRLTALLSSHCNFLISVVRPVLALLFSQVSVYCSSVATSISFVD